jgi:dTDP-4-dehydrorhamnose reductase
MKQNVTITGSTGLLGQYLCQYFSKNYNVTALYNNSAVPLHIQGSVQLDLTDLAKTKSYFSQHTPDFLIHCAGLTSVDACQEYPDLALALNAGITSNLVQSLKASKTRLVHISTDHLFAGKTSFYTEDETPTPINSYAKTKHAAEQFAAMFENVVMIRTNFYGGKTLKKKSFSNWVYDELKGERRIKLFDDVFFTPISVTALSQNLDHLMNSQLCGIYNIVGNERISKFTFAHMLANFFQLNSELIIQSKIGDAPLKAPRPHDMSLSIDKVKNDLPLFCEESVSMGFKKIKSEGLL